MLGTQRGELKVQTLSQCAGSTSPVSLPQGQLGAPSNTSVRILRHSYFKMPFGPSVPKSQLVTRARSPRCRQGKTSNVENVGSLRKDAMQKTQTLLVKEVTSLALLFCF